MFHAGRLLSLIIVGMGWQDQNPIITRHPQHPNLLVVGGASYTYAKDLPKIGVAIVDTLNENERDSFRWDKSLA